MTTNEISRSNELVEKGKQRADWFEPSAEVILASTAKMLLTQLTAKHEDEKAELEARIQLATENALTAAILMGKKEDTDNIINNVAQVLMPGHVDLSKTDVTPTT
jgi:hypothetical protein